MVGAREVVNEVLLACRIVVFGKGLSRLSDAEVPDNPSPLIERQLEGRRGVIDGPLKIGEIEGRKGELNDDGGQRRGVAEPGGVGCEIDFRQHIGSRRIDPEFFGLDVLLRDVQIRVVLQGKLYDRLKVEGRFRCN